MNNFIVRLITGVLLVAAVVLSLIFSVELLFVIFFVFGCVGLYEFFQIIQFQKDKYFNFQAAFISFGLIYIPTVCEMANYCELSAKPFYIIAFLFLAIIALTKKPSLTELNKTLSSFAGLIYVAFPFALIPIIVYSSGTYSYSLLLGVFSFLWMSDTFAYLFGRAFGKHKLLERISPGKTIEGFLGGLISTSILAFFVAPMLSADYSALQWAAFAMIVSTFGTLGDLFESFLKRSVGIKDSGTFLPGHGGILDRYDSLLFALPAVYACNLIL